MSAMRKRSPTKADHLARQAADEAQKLKAVLDDANDRALQSHGYAVAEALKAGRQPPVSIPAPADSEHLASASAYNHALEFAAGEL